LVLLYRLVQKRSNAQALAYSSLAFMERALRSRRIEWLLVPIWLVAAVALALAPAGTRVVAQVPARDGAVVICIDTSGSMASTDVSPTREGAARSAVRTFVDAAPPGLQIALVSFATNATVVQPPTDDLEQTREAIGRIPEANGATAIGDALLAANQLLSNRGRRIVVLLTDGVNNRGSDPLEAAKVLAARGIPVYTVGIGTNGSGELIPGTDEAAEIDEDALRAIAASGGGTYARVSERGELEGVFRQLAGSIVWERRRVDASLPLALGGACTLILAFFARLALGRFP
jgi:Ca-activated chloride channel family protein